MLINPVAHRRRTLPLASLALLLAACDKSPVEPALGRAKTPPALAAQLVPSETSAVAISNEIQQLHLPYSTIADPVFASGDPSSADFNTVVGYDHAGDAAIWTGHYLAGEAFRVAVTASAEALANVRHALDGLTALVDVTSPAKPDLLARFYMPQSSPYASGIIAIEQRHGIYASTLNGEPVYWVGNTTRDQYDGVFFGLAIAYDFTKDKTVKSRVRDLATRMLDFLLANNWNIVMPDGSISSTYQGRPDQQLALLQIGRRVNPSKYSATYATYRAALAPTVAGPVIAECQDTYGSYFKFNLDYITFYNLVRLEPTTSPYRDVYLAAYRQLRQCTASHQNAHFNLVDNALAGPDAARDADTRSYLGLWLERPRRDYFVDLRSKYAACGENRACEPVPVNERPPADFLWQRSPLLLYGGGEGRTEEPGIDYVLPYWMGRFYGVLSG
jgi:hypothetical protein